MGKYILIKLKKKRFQEEIPHKAKGCIQVVSNYVHETVLKEKT